MLATMTSYFNNMTTIDPYEYAGYIDDRFWNMDMPRYIPDAMPGWMDKASGFASGAWVWTRDNVLVDNLDRIVYNGTMKVVGWTTDTLRSVQMPSTPALTPENVFAALSLMLFMIWVIGSIMDIWALRRAIDNNKMIDGVSTMDGFTKPRRETRIVTRSMTAAVDRDIMNLLATVDEITTRDIYLALSMKYPFATLDLVKSRLFIMRDNGDLLMTRERRTKSFWSSR